ncbi:DUF3052 domain-containing protein [Streptomyces sp. KA12]|uniref:DUF3052 domain-containing protein n=1 Tax=Streptomyces sp. KA12 TaxID=2991730 RepID=UPI0023B00B41|nr:DUF3052 domain-containing protein [Streptomyces sp. KA12]MDF0376274.1 DUF3052 domain-containing protein [Streptomyces sp. KA12]
MADAGPTLAGRLGFRAGQVVMEIGYHDDVDQMLRDDIEKVTGQSMVDEEYTGWVDVVLLWHRQDADDPADTLADAVPPLTDTGYVLILTPKPGREGHVDPYAIAEALSATTLAQDPSTVVGDHWTAMRLVDPRSKY